MQAIRSLGFSKNRETKKIARPNALLFSYPRGENTALRGILTKPGNPFIITLSNAI
jgi:hypothetical protein